MAESQDFRNPASDARLRPGAPSPRLMGFLWGLGMCVAVVLFGLAYVAINGMSMAVRAFSSVTRRFR